MPINPQDTASLIEPNAQGQVVIGVLSDTHGRLPAEAFRALADLDPQLIVHAGDICGDQILPQLEMLAPVIAVLGNNDYSGEYGPKVRSRAEFDLMGVSFSVTHMPSRLGALVTRMAICGHTHVPKVEQCGHTTIVNPGSVSRPRDTKGPTIAKIVLDQGYVRQTQIIQTVH